MNWSNLAREGRDDNRQLRMRLSSALAGAKLSWDDLSLDDLRSGRLVVSGHVLGAAEPVLTIAVSAGRCQWWWASKSATEDNCHVSKCVQEFGSGIAELEAATVEVDTLMVGGESVSEDVCAALTGLVDGAVFESVSAGSNHLVVAVPVEVIEYVKDLELR